jgi:hypothetical protein
MNGALLPALLAAIVGSSMFGVIAAHEAQQTATMRRSRRAYSVVFPMGLSAEAALAGLKSLTGLGPAHELVAEITADEHGIRHIWHLPTAVAETTIAQLSTAMPGVRFEVIESQSTGEITAAARVAVSSQALLRTDEVMHASRALLSGFGRLGRGQRLSLRWAIRPAEAPMLLEPDAESGPRTVKARAVAQAWRRQWGEPGFVCEGLILVRASRDSRARALITGLVTALRARQGIGRGLIVRRTGTRGLREVPKAGRHFLNASELLPLLGLPLGDEPIPGVELGAVRRLPVPAGFPTEGRPVFTGVNHYGGDRPVALSAEAATRHLCVIGATGAGKTTVLIQGAVSDLVRGVGGLLLDPKAGRTGLAEEFMEHVPPELIDQVVVVDPSRPGPIPGFSLFGGGDPDLLADTLLSVLRSVVPEWGIRLETWGRLALRTLAEVPGATLLDMEALFTDADVRRAALKHVSDPVLLAQWRSYEDLSPAERSNQIQSPMSRVTSIVARPALRNVLCQQSPKLDLGQLLEQGKWVLVSASPGELSQPVATLLSTIVLYLASSAIEKRGALSSEERRPLSLVVDELQTVAEHLPYGVETFLERSRGFGCGVTVATQVLSRLPTATRRSLLGNVGTLMVLGASPEDANAVAPALPGLSSQDLLSLRAYEVVARVSTGEGIGRVVMTGKTEPLGPPTGQADAIRALSAERYGVDPAAINARLAERAKPASTTKPPVLGRHRRDA